MAYQIILFAAAIILTIVLLRKKVNVGLIMLINCIFIILSVGMKAESIFRNTMDGITRINTINVLIILTEIMIVENIMRKTKMIEKMVVSLRGIIGNGKISAMLLPALIGLMPSPGGARFSCPMVDELLADEMDNSDKAYLNFWFRHIWRDGFILYPAVIIASEILGVTVLQLFIHIFVFTVLHCVIGYVYLRKRIIVKKEKHEEDRKKLIRVFIMNFLPVAIIILTYMLLLSLFGDALKSQGITTMVLLNAAVIPVIVFLLIRNKYDLQKVWSTLKEAFQIKFIIIIIGVMVFKEFLTDSGLIDVWIRFITDNNFPKEILYVVLPFIAGLTSGLALNYASLALPILIPLGIDGNLWLASAAMMAGYAGVSVTPLHLCSIITSDYFKADIHRVIKRAVVSESFMLIAIIATIYIFR